MHHGAACRALVEECQHFQQLLHDEKEAIKQLPEMLLNTDIPATLGRWAGGRGACMGAPCRRPN
jgi:hypothetical protein